MAGLRTAVADYLMVRRALGYRLTGAARLLGQFVDYAEAAGADTITTELAVDWAILPGASSAWHSQRLSAVRGFAHWRQATDPATEVPPSGLLPARKQRPVPYLFTPGEAARLADAAAGLCPALKAASMRAFIGLVFSTGMRRGEALGLDRADLDVVSGVLTVRAAKFGKPRQLPLHASVLAELDRYMRTRDRLCPQPHTSALLLSTTGRRLTASTVSQAFRDLLETTGIGRQAPRRPRIHDARHSLAVATLLDRYRDGGDVQARIPLLATWLGHTDPRHTYWYLQAAPELLAMAAERLDDQAGGVR